MICDSILIKGVHRKKDYYYLEKNEESYLESYFSIFKYTLKSFMLEIIILKVSIQRSTSIKI
jgi:hypothetical protein